MRWYRRHWYELGLPIALAAIVVALVIDMTTLRTILLLNFAALVIHQFEEYGWPGGEPAIINKAIKPQYGAPKPMARFMHPSKDPTRYPLNQNSALIINVFAAWPFYLLPVFFPTVGWLALAPVLFGFGQFGMHGILVNKLLRTMYNPGLAAVVLGHIPLGIWYIVEGYDKNAISGWDWAIAAVYTIAFIAITLFKMTYTWLADQNSPYPFAPEEMRRFNIDARLAKIDAAHASTPSQ